MGHEQGHTAQVARLDVDSGRGVYVEVGQRVLDSARADDDVEDHVHEPEEHHEADAGVQDADCGPDVAVGELESPQRFVLDVAGPDAEVDRFSEIVDLKERNKISA